LQHNRFTTKTTFMKNKSLPGKKTLLMLSCVAITLLALPSYRRLKNKPATIIDGLAAITLKAQQIATGLHAPTAAAFPGNGTLWITEQDGKIRLVKNGKMSATNVLDLHSKLVNINDSYDERGLLGIALHPQFAANHKFYVFYSAPSNAPKSDHKGTLAEYRLLPNSDMADPKSARIVLTVEEPESNHNGGCIQFGSDGYLYVGLGDGGGAGDRHGETGNGQKLDTWLGKILRIDVNTETGYKVPKDNPFVDKGNAKPEIWAYGLRNPWRFSFDRVSNQLFAGDVGQDTWEEVDIITKGANYGWRLTEGTHCFNPSSGCPTKGITMPITEYSHKEGISVTGGYVYNGAQIAALKAKYVFADWTGPIFYLEKNGDKWLRGKVTLQNYPTNLKITAFGEDPSGELYVLTNPDTGPGNTSGGMFKIVKN
jgi:glucose/arabinose dehydrogenase